MLGISPTRGVVGQKLGNRPIPGHAAGLFKAEASPVSVAGGDGVLSRLRQRSRLSGQFPGQGEAHGRIGTQTHVTAPAGQGKAIDPALSASLGNLEIEPAAVMQISGSLGAAN
jgi:hypothetical protein